MIGKAPRWIIVVVGIVAFIWVIPIMGIVVTSFRPPEGVSLGWWRFDHFDLTLDAWRRVWDKYPLADSMWVTMKTAGIATALTM
ncbi:MAG: carbohydrate ABC transporter permease, partial [Rhizobium sp.]